MDAKRSWKLFGTRSEFDLEHELRPVEFEVLNSVEQAALVALSDRGATSLDFLAKHLLEDFRSPVTANTRRLETTDGVVFMSLIAGHLARLLDHATGKLGLRVVSEHNRLEVLSNPICFTEFAREGARYVSRLYLRDDVKDREEARASEAGSEAIGEMVRRFADPRAFIVVNDGDDETRSASETFDDTLSNRFRALFSSDPEQLPGLRRTPIASAEDFGINGRVDLRIVAAATARHLVEHYGHLTRKEDGGYPRPTNSQLRSAVLDWYDKLKKQAGLRRTNLDSKIFLPVHDYDEPINILPYVALEPLGGTSSILMMLCVTPFDPWFVDDRVPEDVRLPNISVGFFDTSQIASISRSELREVQQSVRTSLSSLTARMIAQARGDTLALAAGEAAAIGRYWYSEGISKLFEDDIKRAGLEETSTTDFWQDFVSELLCAQIPGIKQTETYPFDRAMLIEAVGSSPDRQIERLEMTVLETALESVAPQDRFETLTSIERRDRELDREFDLTKKTIKHASKVELVRDDVGISLRCRPRDIAYSDMDSVVSFRIPEKTSDGACELTLRSILPARPGEGIDTELVGKIRTLFDNSGLLYSYGSGTNLLADEPLLSEVLRGYFDYLRGIVSKSDKVETGEEALRRISRTDSKVVVFSFDPTLSEQNRRTATDESSGNQTDRLYLPKSNQITLILVADEDIEKSIQESNAEREDLRLLLQMIISQRLQDRQNEEGVLENRLRTVEAVLSSIFHRISALEIDANVKQQIRRQWESARELMSFDADSLEQFRVTSSGGLFRLLSMGRDDKDGGLSAEREMEIAEEAVRRRLDDLQQSFGLERGFKFTLLKNPLPEFSLRLPEAAFRECFDIVLKNALEAALTSPAGIEPEINLSAEVRPDGSNRWVLDIRVDNTTKPLLRQTWLALTAETPVGMGENTEKKDSTGHSTGVGVYSARQLLRMGFGHSSDIYYEPIGPNWLRARISVPCHVTPPELYEEDDLDGQDETSATDANSPQARQAEGDYLLYVEDDEDVHNRVMEQLRAKLPDVPIRDVNNASDAIDLIEKRLPRILLADLSIKKSPKGRTSQPKYGASLIHVFAREADKHQDTDAQCLVLSGRTATEAGRLISQGIPDLDLDIEPVRQPWNTMGTGAMIRVFEQLKYPTEHPLFLDYLRTVFEPLAASAATGPEPVASPAQWRLLSKSKDLDRAISELGEVGEDETVFLPIPGKDAFACLAAWFAHPGMVDRELRNPLAFPLHLADYNTFFAGTLPIPAEFDGLPFRYWLLKSKIATEAALTGEGGGLWPDLNNESNGALSRLRHDVRNIRIDSITPALLREIEATTTSLETALAFPGDRLVRALQDDGKEGRKAFAAIVEPLSFPAQPELAEQVERHFNKLSDALATIREAAGGAVSRPVESVEGLQNALRALHHFLFAGSAGR